jgi:hypothetical protein
MTTHHVLPNRHLRLQKTKKKMKMDQCTSHTGTLGKARARTWGMMKDTYQRILVSGDGFEFTLHIKVNSLIVFYSKN